MITTMFPFQLVESRDRDGALRIALLGELDLAVADQLSARLDRLSSEATRVRLDLSGLEFIDSAGVRALVLAARHARRNGDYGLEVGHEMTPSVRTMIDLVGVAPVLWPPDNSSA